MTLLRRRAAHDVRFFSRRPTGSPIFRVWEPAMLTIDTEQEDDGRWVAEITALPGVMAYGTTQAEARQKAG